jgi:hypothetical protein
MSTDDRQEKTDRDAQEVSERRASTSTESPTNVARSTQDLSIGGTRNHAESRSGAGAPGPQLPQAPRADQKKASSPSPEATEGGGEQSAGGLSNAEQAVRNQQSALESGEESPG